MKPSSNPEYGMCITLFESRANSSHTDSQRDDFLRIPNSDHPTGGLHLVLDINYAEYLPYQLEKGFILMIHSNSDSADVSAQGIWLPTDRTTYIGMEKV